MFPILSSRVTKTKCFKNECKSFLTIRIIMSWCHWDKKKKHPIPGTPGTCWPTEDWMLTPIQRSLTNLFYFEWGKTFIFYIYLVLAEERQRWWWRWPAFIGYHSSGIRMLPHKRHLHFFLVSTLWRLNLQVWTRMRELFFLNKLLKAVLSSGISYCRWVITSFYFKHLLSRNQAVAAARKGLP